jgi:outer membrane protein OmpA-like peptidoglycan-associated protein
VTRRGLLSGACALALAGCATGFHDEAGSIIDPGTFGDANMNNFMVQTGQLAPMMDLARRFNAEVPDTVNFAFDSAVLDAEARAILDRQADWIRQFPEVRFRVFGHTDLVGPADYNYRLGQRRAQAVVNHLVGRGVDRSRLEAMVSFGLTQPLIPTPEPERRNRRTVTEVSGFVQSHPMVMDGQYALIVRREYIESATRPLPRISRTRGAFTN